MADKADAIQAYIFAKDSNRPFMLDTAFAEDATVQMNVRTKSISFPPVFSGREAITDTLVREFNKKYENIYTICIGDRPEIVGTNFSCCWLVVMSEKLNRSLRVGCGSYDWQFCSGNDRVQPLSITIEKMEPASAELMAEVMGWISELAYPWCEFSAIAKELPNNEVVLSVMRALEAMLSNAAITKQT